MRRPTRLDCAYAAGIFDGEGCCGISKARHRRRDGSWGGPYYEAFLVVSTSERPLAEWLQQRWGGAINRRRQGVRAVLQETKPQYVWTLGPSAAEGFLLDVLPYLRIKLAQADNVIGLREAVGEAEQQACWARHREIMGPIKRRESRVFPVAEPAPEGT